MNALALLLENLAASDFSTFNEMYPATSRYAIAVSKTNSQPVFTSGQTWRTGPGRLLQIHLSQCRKDQRGSTVLK